MDEMTREKERQLSEYAGAVGAAAGEREAFHETQEKLMQKVATAEANREQAEKKAAEWEDQFKEASQKADDLEHRLAQVCNITQCTLHDIQRGRLGPQGRDVPVR